MNINESAFKKSGFMHYKAKAKCSSQEMDTLLTEVACLQKDPYAPQETIRKRSYGNAIILPWEADKLYWLPTAKHDGKEKSGYDQGSNNPDHDSIRYFNALSKAFKATEFINELVLEDYNHTFGLSEHYLPIYVGVHLVSVSCTNNAKPGFSSPDCFHQDGEPFTFAHLVNRSENAVGGKNYIAGTAIRNKTLPEVSDSDIIHEFQLDGFMDSFAVCDDLVSHYVDHLYMKDPSSPVERTMILIDFSRTKQSI